MRADMQIVNLLPSGRRIADKKTEECGMRKENIIHTRDDASLSARDSVQDAKDVSFREALESVEHTGDGAHTNRAKTRSGADRSEKQPRKEEVTKWQNVIASETAQKKVADTGYTATKQAVTLLEETLATISEKLHLESTLTEGLQNVNFAVPSDVVLEQLSEILFALQGIRQLLEQAAQQNVALDIRGILIEPDEAALLEKSLRVELFRLQIALESLGVAGDVSRTVADKMDMPVMDGGIPRAADLSTLSMPDNQLQQLIGDMIKSEEDQIHAVIARIAAVANEQTVDERLAALVKAQVPEEKQVSVTVTGVTTERSGDGEKPPDHGMFDSLILRRLLNIDENAKPFTEEDNSGTGTKNEKPALFSQTPGTADSMKQNPQLFGKKGFQQLINLSQTVEQGQQIAHMETPGHNDSQIADVASRLPSMRSIEETVMVQVAQRLNAAVRNGLHEIRLILRPESLGDVRMTIRMEGDIVMARIHVENQQVKQIIESNLQSLKDSLEEQNLQAGNFDVNVNQGSEKEMQDLAHLGRNTRSRDTAEEIMQQDRDDKTMNIGTETGRRFGSNTIEYFA